jgi:hypothetical protein
MGTAMKRLKLKCLLAGLLALPMSWALAAIDPMAPPKVGVDHVAAPQASTLEWIRMNEHDSIARYRGVTVKVGDAVEGGRVSAIREDHIVISGKGGRRSIYLLERSVRSNFKH